MFEKTELAESQILPAAGLKVDEVFCKLQGDKNKDTHLAARSPLSHLCPLYPG